MSEKPETDTNQEEDQVICDNCDEQINCIKSNIYCLSKDKMEMTICYSCFEDCWRDMRDDGWECDDFSQQSEAEK
jgi:hypothetical protein